MVCPLETLEHRFIAPDRLIIVFKNTAGCVPFNEQNQRPGYAPTIGLVNQVALQSEFQCGSLSENWEGKRRYVCRMPGGKAIEKETTREADAQAVARGEHMGIYESYYPRVELQGALRIVGSFFENKGETL